MTLGTVPVASEVAKRNLIGSDERLGNSGGAQPLASSLSNRMILQQHTKSSDGSGLGDFGNIADAAVSGRTFHLFLGSNGGLEAYFRVKVKWDREDLRLLLIKGKSFCRGFRGCSKSSSKVIAIFSECLVLLEETLSHSQGSSKTTLLQQLSSQNSSISSQGGLGLGFQSTGLSTSMSASVVQQPMSLHQQGSLLGGQKDSVVEDQQQQSLPDDSATEMTPGSGLSKHLINDDDLKASYVNDVSTAGVSGPLADAPQRDIDLSPGQPLQSGQQSSSLGVIGRRSVSDLGAIGDIMSGTASSGNVHDYQYNLQMLEAAYFKLPQPKDSERAKSYTPRHPAATPSSYPQVQAPIVNNSAFWERMGLDTLGTDTLFFTFYYQPNTYQQFLAAKELKKQSWRYHRKFNTWFQRHEEPKVTTDDYEKGTYVYFDFHVANDDPNQGWCQRIKTDFCFEYNYLEDDLIV